MKIDFEFDTQYGVFRDALYFPDDQVPDDATIEAMKIARRDSWVSFIENPPPNPNPIPDEEIVEETPEEQPQE